MKKIAILLSVLVLAAAILIGVQIAQRNTLDREKTQALDRVATLTADLGKSGEALAQAQASLESITQEKDELFASLDSAKQSLQEALNQVKGLGEEKLKLETALSEAQQQATESAGQVTQLTEDKDKLALELAEAQVKLDTATLSVSDLQARLAELTKLEGDYLALQQQYDEAVEAAKVTPEPVDVTKSEEYAALQAEYNALKLRQEELNQQILDQEAAILQAREEALAAQTTHQAEGTEAPAEVKSGEIVVFFTNSVQQKVAGDEETRIGYPKLATVLKDAREGAELLLLDSGDALFGSHFPGDTKGEPVVELMNLLGYDAAVPGYYDFYLGAGRVEELAASANYDMLGSNLLSADGQPVFKPHVIKEVGGRRIALVGAMAPGVLAATDSRYEGLTTADLDQVRQAVAAAREEDADALILLAHGRDTDAEALAQIPDVDLVLLGRNKPVDLEQRIGETLVLSAGSQLRSIGHALLTFDENGKLSITPSFISFDMASDVTPDSEVQQLITVK